MKPLLLVKVISDLKMDQALIFCRTNVDCNNLERFLTALGGGRGFRGQVRVVRVCSPCGVVFISCPCLFALFCFSVKVARRTRECCSCLRTIHPLKSNRVLLAAFLSALFVAGTRVVCSRA